VSPVGKTLHAHGRKASPRASIIMVRARPITEAAEIPTRIPTRAIRPDGIMKVSARLSGPNWEVVQR
jgi:hypothetical protein